IPSIHQPSSAPTIGSSSGCSGRGPISCLGGGSGSSSAAGSRSTGPTRWGSGRRHPGPRPPAHDGGRDPRGGRAPATGRARSGRQRGAGDALVASRDDPGFMQSWAWSRFKELEGYRAVRVGLTSGGLLIGGGIAYLYPTPAEATLAVLPDGPVLDWDAADA